MSLREGVVEHTEWAIRCGCGELLPQLDELAAVRACANFNTTNTAGKHGQAIVLYRRVITSDWSQIRESART